MIRGHNFILKISVFRGGSVIIINVLEWPPWVMMVIFAHQHPVKRKRQVPATEYHIGINFFPLWPSSKDEASRLHTLIFLFSNKQIFPPLKEDGIA